MLCTENTFTITQGKAVIWQSGKGTEGAALRNGLLRQLAAVTVDVQLCPSELFEAYGVAVSTVAQPAADGVKEGFQPVLDGVEDGFQPVTDAVGDRLAERPEILTPPNRHAEVVVAAARIAVLAAPFFLVALLSTPRPGVLPLLSVGVAWSLVMRGARSALPPAARLGSVSGTAAGVIVALTTTVVIIFVLGHASVRPSQLLVIGLGVLVLSAAFEAWLQRRKPLVRVLVVGKDAGGSELAQALSEGPNLRCSLVGLVGDGQRSDVDRVATHQLEDFVSKERPDLVVLTDTVGRDEALDRLLKVRAPSFRVVSLDHFSEWVYGRVSVSTVSPMWFMSLLHAYARPYSRLTKRVFDLSLAGLALAFVWPAMLVIALLVRNSGAGPILYRQVRAGEAGVPFEMLKFRTMAHGAEVDGKAAWAQEKDPRVTRIGRVLRRYRLDELPQMWNVLQGEMSIVGPRPERPEFVAVLEREIPFWSRRHLVKPGVTGWAQIRHGYTSDPLAAADKLAYDLYYIKHRGVLLDLMIVLRTLRVVFRGEGAR